MTHAVTHTGGVRGLLVCAVTHTGGEGVTRMCVHLTKGVAMLPATLPNMQSVMIRVQHNGLGNTNTTSSLFYLPQSNP